MLSVIITHYRTPEMLKLALGYFRNALKDLGEPYEIIVSDSGTQSPTRDLMQVFCSSPAVSEEHPERSGAESKDPSIIYLPDEKNIGYAKLVNKGIRRANPASEFIFIANADIIASQPSAIKELLSYMRTNPRVGMAGPKLLNFNGTPQASCFRFYTPATILARRTPLGKLPWAKKVLDSFFMNDVPEKDENPTPADWIMGSAYMVRVATIKEVGLLDERFFMYMEDVDWCRRFWEKNWQVMYYPAATMHHYHFQASKKIGGLLGLLRNPYTRVHIASAILYFRKYGFAKTRYGK